LLHPWAFDLLLKEYYGSVEVMTRFTGAVGGAVDVSDIPFEVVDDSRPGVLKLAGELDMATAPVVAARLDGLDGGVELECSGLTFVDSSALRLFLAVQRDCQSRGATLTIVNPSRPVMQLLALTGLDSVLDVRPNGPAS
jgi:anti-sigma B factor antagonist